MKINHKKLVRDNIPGIIEKAGKKCQIHVLDDFQYRNELKKKLVEEAKEVFEADKREEIVEELADVMEIYEALMSTYDITKEEIKDIKDKKVEKNGKFDKKIFLEYVIED